METEHYYTYVLVDCRLFLAVYIESAKPRPRPGLWLVDKQFFFRNVRKGIQTLASLNLEYKSSK